MEDIETLIQNSKDAQRYEEVKQRLGEVQKRVNSDTLFMLLSGFSTALFVGGAYIADTDFGKFAYATAATLSGAFIIPMGVSLGIHAAKRNDLEDKKSRIEAKYAPLETKVEE